MIPVRGYAAQDAKSPLAPFQFERREPGPNDVQLEILYCGVCHSDLHQARDEWGGSLFPMVPGHEIVGRVVRVGDQVKKFKVGDLAGVGCMVDSCRTCPSCQEGLEQYCDVGNIQTYNGKEKDGRTVTQGGYSEAIVVDEAFTLKIPENLDPAAAAPLLCAGITTYSPLRHWKVQPGQRVGVVGLGGLGHMGVKLAKAMGAHVTVFSHTDRKKQDAARLGADAVVVSSNKEEMAAQTGRFDFILDTVSAQHDLNAYLRLLRRDGHLVLVGAPERPLDVRPFSLIPMRRSFSGSMIGGIQETQEMLEFCGKHGIVSDIELISIQQVNDAYERLRKGDVKYRFVIDLASLRK
ncbi:NAD(P)-dependent alcohol dehydrogenase [Myxococcus sp. AM009]|uniref:NAD(P)-dependent alcohol dehydrogenase n=1 Tax=unclassified Myxococcus TaxID=2648731 RepID=UPI0015951A3C|nr:MULTISPECIES: NAD(P)-dependent alcohol dehydrogenase [unclassified Myxococcus]NVJ02187.1 NAD(P)-dependent alcohol dehydrogenase [Myxococcus sp. AM009]NVJ19088.1 NAD(P)-dependent alcohol dehydrogenase [Myxococcus sp. AM010]